MIDGVASYGENKESNPDCRCHPTDVFYWELSDANTDDCPIHGYAPLNLKNVDELFMLDPLIHSIEVS